ncbi:MAG: 2-oxo acid dehydrogenase subunit E2 [Deltaproteobacteria bacterium]|nr:2-oxo acid dehydrogenase subunit E2 [Deltaproteobacteria bacterium]
MLTIIEMPTLSASMEKGKVLKWYKEEGDEVEKGEILFEIETDKANVEIESYTSGFIRKILVREGTEISVNKPIAVIADTIEEDISSVVETMSSETAPPEEEKHLKAESASPDAIDDSERKKIKISPLARRIAKEHGIDIKTVKGTGSGGRITKQDLERAVAERSEGPIAPPKTEALPEIQAGTDDYEEIELTKMRKVIALRLSESKRTAPHFYVDMTADATALIQLKEDLEKGSGQTEVKITFNDILIKLVSQALKEFPMVNASILGDRIRMHRAVNIGVAVGVDEGLIVPVLKNVDQKSISRISREVRDFAERARNKKLLPDEYLGGTFTITNLGMFGVETFHAIINPPESGILSVSSIMQKPVVIDGEITVRPCLKISLSVDHRVVDGVLAARFLGRVKELVEAPLLMFA